MKPTALIYFGDAMAAAKTKTGKSKTTPEILTLGEAAKYLRVSEAVLKSMAEEEGIPARKFGKEWRFLKIALEDWMRWGLPLNGWMPPSWLWSKLAPDEKTGNPNESLLKLAGIWKDDPTAEEMVREIYRRRKDILIGDLQ